MRIRLSGEVGGMVIVVIAGVIAASIIDGILSFIEKHVIKDNEGDKKLFSFLRKVNWIFFILFIVLDLTNVFPLIRTILFAILSRQLNIKNCTKIRKLRCSFLEISFKDNYYRKDIGTLYVPIKY